MVDKAAHILLVGVGGFLGSVARYLVALWMAPITAVFPFATLTVNLLGSFLIGFISELALSTSLISPSTRIFLVTGFCGGFTTFSSYMIEHSALLRDGEHLYAALYLFGSLIGGFIALYLGIISARWMAG
uniref:Fluoride-specific ion channel FluC n=1 Tax=Chlorobium chlorochromatii (strain CaD3) TaxID=340177 RepID=FLUC_CHLCH|nr:RecName: Full=Fluoride-specific ion channel FluC [Chlorobium chlorochromatii CaD3]